MLLYLYSTVSAVDHCLGCTLILNVEVVSIEAHRLLALLARHHDVFFILYSPGLLGLDKCFPFGLGML